MEVNTTDEVKKRRPNWTKEDCLVLTELVGEKKSIIEVKFGPCLTSAKRQEAWQIITATLNSTSAVHRTREEVEKKWKNLKSASKKSMGSYNHQSTATGGGPPPQPLSPLTDAVVEVIGKDNVTLTGIDHGFDSTSLQLLDLMQPSESQILVTADVHSPPKTLANQSASGSAVHFIHLPDPPAHDSVEALTKERLKLEIECLRLKSKYLGLKIKKLEE